VRLHRLVVGDLQTNAYIVADDQGTAAVIDPGGDPGRVESVILSNRLRPNYILCTHGHPDHTFAVGALLQTFEDAIFLLHGLDVPMLESGIDDLGALALLFDAAAYRRPRLGGELSDGQVIPVGSLELTVLHTPGHTPGGICLVCGKDVFTGDTLFAGGIGRTDLPGGSQEALIRSIETRLLTLDDDTRAHPGHGPETTIGEEKRTNPWLRRP